MTRIGFSPVKGMRHLAHDAAEIGPGGVVGDRLLATIKEGRVLRTIAHPSLLAVTATYADGVLRLDFPDGADSPGRVAGPLRSREPVEVDYWGRTARVMAQAGPHADALSAYLQRPVRLAEAAPGEVIYGDALSLITSGELAELARWSGAPVDERRFRANLCLDHPSRLEPGQRLRLGEAVVEVTAPVARCAVIDLNPVTGERDADLLAVLARERRSEQGICFGVQARVLAPGRVQVSAGRGGRPRGR